MTVAASSRDTCVESSFLSDGRDAHGRKDVFMTPLQLMKVADEQKRKPTGEEKNRFSNIFRHLDSEFQAGRLAPDLMLSTFQQVAEGWVIAESGLVVPEKKEIQIFLDKPIQHPHLQLISEFGVEIPNDATLDSTPRTAYCSNGWNPNITDANFRTSLVRGRKYMAEVYQLRRNKSSESLVKIADEQKRVLPGALGGAVLTSSYGELPKNFWVTCLDKPENLWRVAFDLLVPYFYWDGDGWYFCLHWWNDDWPRGFYIVFLRELVSTSP